MLHRYIPFESTQSQLTSQLDSELTSQLTSQLTVTVNSVNCFQRPRLHLASNAGFSRRGRGTRVAPVLRGPEVRVVLNSSSWSGKSRVDRCV